MKATDRNELNKGISMTSKTTAMSPLRVLIALSATVMALLVAAGPVLAQEATRDGYAGPSESVQGDVQGGDDDEGGSSPQVLGQDDSGTPSAPQPASTSTLPFTGLELGLIAAIGAVLLLVGLGMRRLSRADGGPGGLAR
jgi:hypothetical protein